MSENQIVPVSFLPESGEWGMIKEIAGIIAVANGMTPAKMTDVILKGRSLGLSIPASIELVQNVAGKTSLAPRGALAMVQGSPLIENVTITRLMDKNTFVGYECTIKRKNGFEYTSRWTIEQATKAGLVKPGSGWVNYPENMCLWRAVGFACDVAASDITCGLTAFMKMPEQFGIQLTEAGDIVEGKIIEPLQIDPVTVEIERLTIMHGTDAFMVACDGNIPTTAEELYAIATKLENQGKPETQE